MFAGFPGFVSKLWLTADEDERYRGFYQWDGAAAADDYVSALWWPLALVSDRTSIRYCVLPGARRDEVLAGSIAPEVGTVPTGGPWWRLVRTGSRPR